MNKKYASYLLLFISTVTHDTVIGSHPDIFKALQSNDYAHVESLLTHDPSLINVRNQYQQTPLHHAAIGQPRIVELLINHGADVHAQDNLGKTPLHWATRPENVQLLIDAHADINARDSNRKTPLHWSLFLRRGAVTDALIDAGADLDAQDRSGKTALHYAALMGNSECGDRLIAEGADVLLVDCKQHSPLRAAAQNRKLNVIDRLLVFGVSLQKKDIEGLKNLSAPSLLQQGDNQSGFDFAATIQIRRAIRQPELVDITNMLTENRSKETSLPADLLGLLLDFDATPLPHHIERNSSSF